MSFSRRDFLMAGSAFSTVWLAGCGGGGSASGAPKVSSGGGTPPAATCNASRATTGIGDPDPAQLKVMFSHAVGMSDVGLDLTIDPVLSNTIYGCTNQSVYGVEGLSQELFVSAVQMLPASQTSIGRALIRNLRMHLSIPHDTSGTVFQQGDTFTVGDPTSTHACYVFNGTLLVTDPSAATNGSWAYQIVSGVVEIVGVVTTLKLSNVVATAAAAGVGAGVNAAGAPDQIEMNGYLPVLTEYLTLPLAKR